MLGLDIVGRGLAALGFRYRVLANDLANASTPGFLAQDVAAFPAVLQRAMTLDRTSIRQFTGDPADSAGPAGTIVTTSGLLTAPGGSGVDPDATMARIADVAVQYQALAQAAHAEVSIAKEAVTGWEANRWIHWSRVLA